MSLRMSLSSLQIELLRLLECHVGNIFGNSFNKCILELVKDNRLSKQ